ncbi:hypothetical protein PLEOSDRAFT_1087921 [Pleurotus ostreatus PC15]|uniref:BTB domain-containing protein n=1 Tax=Pleurotus ostreatus (strain PC15) TaxID=1137138 RepID=A0A067P0J9_PLEO1|nr:hypothetical protein PLEOSDRAFT_1087921 [Pleurotus ostreatus PC15]
MESSRPEDTPRTYHPAFASPEANVVLRSAEGTLYRVPSFVLVNTTEFFRNGISPHATGTAGNDVLIPVNEKDAILERLLRMLCGLSTSRWQGYDEVEGVLKLAEEWNTPGPLAAIRAAITTPLFLASPLRLFAVATHFGWEEEAKLASRYTLALSLYDEEHQELLQRLPSKDVLALLGLHRKRRDEFKRLLDTETVFDAGNSDPRFCRECGERLDNHTWRELKIRMFMEMDRRPLGDIVGGLDMEEWPEAQACWNAKCGKETCGKPNYDRLVMLQGIQGCIAKLSDSL